MRIVSSETEPVEDSQRQVDLLSHLIVSDALFPPGVLDDQGRLDAGIPRHPLWEVVCLTISNVTPPVAMLTIHDALVTSVNPDRLPAISLAGIVNLDDHVIDRSEHILTLCPLSWSACHSRRSSRRLSSRCASEHERIRRRCRACPLHGSF